MNNLTIASFFSGAMGLDLGLEKAGCKTVFTCEFDKSAIETIRFNRPDLPILKDIRDFDYEDFLDKTKGVHIDVVAGGPPCQAFSTAGKRRGFSDERGNVFLKYLDVIETIKPTFFVLENVRGLLSTKYELDFDEFERVGLPAELYGKPGSAVLYTCRRMEMAGYAVNYNLYNAANYGVPQKRERVVLMGSKIGAEVPFLHPTHSENGEHGLKKWQTLRNALKGLDYTDDQWVELSDKTKKFLSQLKEGEYWKNLPLNAQKEAMGGSFHLQGGKTGFYRRLDFNKPSPTLVTSPSMPATLLGHPTELRPLSVKEYARVQQFPDDWKIQGSKINIYKQIGNAVPVGLGYAIGMTLNNLVNGTTPELVQGFKYSRYKNTSYSEMALSLNKQLKLL